LRPKNGPKAPGSEPRSREELEEEVVSVAALAHERVFEPGFQLLSSCLRQAIDELIRSIRLGYGPASDEAVSHQTVQNLVQMTDVQLSPLGSDGLLELRLRLVRDDPPERCRGARAAARRTSARLNASSSADNRPNRLVAPVGRGRRAHRSAAEEVPWLHELTVASTPGSWDGCKRPTAARWRQTRR
jgi:hypothetical protein